MHISIFRPLSDGDFFFRSLAKSARIALSGRLTGSRRGHHGPETRTTTMQNETVSTPPSQGGVFCSPPLARAHVDCRNYRRQTGYKYISCSQTTGACTRVTRTRGLTAPFSGKEYLNGDIKISLLDRARTRDRRRKCPIPALWRDGAPDFLQKAKKGENSFEHCKHWTKTTLRGRRGA